MIEVVIAVLLQFDTGSDISFAPLNSNLRNKRHGLDVIVFYKKKRLKIYILIYYFKYMEPSAISWKTVELCIGLNPGTGSRIISEYGPFLGSLE